MKNRMSSTLDWISVNVEHALKWCDFVPVNWMWTVWNLFGKCIGCSALRQNSHLNHSWFMVTWLRNACCAYGDTFVKPLWSVCDIDGGRWHSWSLHSGITDSLFGNSLGTCKETVWRHTASVTCSQPLQDAAFRDPNVTRSRFPCDACRLPASFIAISYVLHKWPSNLHLDGKWLRST
jgi:hypothetical protein